jgi:hypothetical protein
MELCCKKINTSGVVGGRWGLTQGDMRPALANRLGGCLTAGWSICHLRTWFTADLKLKLTELYEMQRLAVRAGAYIIETLTTGSLTLRAPAALYMPGWKASGIHPANHRTDYQFASVEEAASGCWFSLGDLSASIRAQGWARLPEWTGYGARS